jgi:hypothetical protein
MDENLEDRLVTFLEENLYNTDESVFCEGGFTYIDSIEVVKLGEYRLNAYVAIHESMALDMDVYVSPDTIGKPYELSLCVRKLVYRDQVYFLHEGALWNGNEKLEKSLYKSLLDAIAPYILERAMNLSEPYSLIPDLEGYDVMPGEFILRLSTQLREEAYTYGLSFNIELSRTTIAGEATLGENYCLERIDRPLPPVGDMGLEAAYRDAVLSMARDIRVKAQERLADLLAFITITYK